MAYDFNFEDLFSISGDWNKIKDFFYEIFKVFTVIPLQIESCTDLDILNWNYLNHVIYDVDWNMVWTNFDD